MKIFESLVLQKMKTILIFILGAIVASAALIGFAWMKYSGGSSHIPSELGEAHLERLPFDGEWYVFWGGEQKEQNHHHGSRNQHLAMDLLMGTESNRTKEDADGKKNEDYKCWDREIYAPHEGEVVVSVDGVPDNIPGEMNRYMVFGNTIMIKHPDGWVSVIAHLRNGSVLKERGDRVIAGDLVGRCGNSGRSTEPHLHYHIQSEEGFERGIAMKPIFKQIEVNGETKYNYSPLKGDTIKHEN